MPLSEGQVRVRDLIMGRSTSYKMLEFNPWIRTVRADQGDKRAWNHGSWSGVEWSDEAVVPMRVQVLGSSAATWLTLDQQLKAAFRPVGEATSDVELRWLIGGVEYVMFGRPRMVEPEAAMLGTGLVYTKAAFVALDPTIYAGVETVTSPLVPPSFTGGLTIPLTVPFTVDGVMTGGSATLTNSGTKETGLLLRIDGPAVEPRVTLERADGVIQTLRIGITLPAGQWLDIDTANRTVTLNGTTSRRGQTTGDFPILPSGAHTLIFRTTDANPASELTARFRSAWW